MKKLLSLIISVVVIMSFGFYVNANESKTITLSPGWNVVSTPAILSSIAFSNQGEGISFSKLSNGAWISVPATVENVMPLEGFMVYSNNTNDVTMTLKYKTDVTPEQSMLKRNLNYGWDLLGIVTTNSPFNNIGAAATMSVDFTDNGTTNYLNKVNDNYTFNSTSSSVANLQLGEAYGIFINQQNAIYGGVNGGGTTTGGNDVDCTDDSVVQVCNVNGDTCPEECRLSIDYKNFTNQNVISQGVSDLDEISVVIPYGGVVSSITLQKYGYASTENISAVRLEDDRGNVIANAKSIDVNGKALLQIKDDYKVTSKNFKVRVVVETNGIGILDKALGFKVINTNVNDNDYSFNDDNVPYLYNSINYAGYVVKITPSGENRNYNRADGEFYEVSKFKVTAGDVDMIMKGFVLTNSGHMNLENDKTTIAVELESGELENIETQINKSDELVVTFDDLEIPAGATVTFTVKIKIKDFDQRGNTLEYSIREAADIRVIEKITKVRTVVEMNAGTWGIYTFEGGKIKFTNTKLENLDVMPGTTGIIVASGNIEITEPITMSFNIIGNNTGVDDMKLKVGQYEYAAARTLEDGNVVFSFKNVSIEKSGAIQFFVDSDIDAVPNSSVIFNTLSKSIIEAKYNNSNHYVDTGNILGSITFSKVTFIGPKAALQNYLTKAVEFYQNQTDKKVVFDGMYIVRKGDIFLNKAYIEGFSLGEGNIITFYLSVGGEEVAIIDGLGSGHGVTFSNIKVESGTSINVKVEAEIHSYGDVTSSDSSYALVLEGEDSNGNEAGKASDITVALRIKKKGPIIVSSASRQKTVLLKANRQKIAEFVVKPSSEEITLYNLVISGNINGVALTSGDIVMRVGNIEYEIDSESPLTYLIDKDINTEGEVVEILLRNENKGVVTLDILSINGVAENRTFVKRFENAVVYIEQQTNNGSYTEYTLGVEKYSNDIEVSNLEVYADSDYNLVFSKDQALNDGDKFQIVSDDIAHMISKISYDVTTGGQTERIEMLKHEYPDYFTLGDKDLIIYSNL